MLYSFANRIKRTAAMPDAVRVQLGNVAGMPPIGAKVTFDIATAETCDIVQASSVDALTEAQAYARYTI